MLTFDEELHQYRVNGFLVPSVTQLLRILAPTLDHIDEEVLEAASERGKKWHSELSRLARNPQLTGTDEKESIALRDMLHKYLSEGWEVCASEEPFCFDTDQRDPGVFNFAGTPDLVLHRVQTVQQLAPNSPPQFVNQYKVIDLKTGVYHPVHELQLGFYQILVHKHKQFFELNKLTGQQFKEAEIWSLSKDGKLTAALYEPGVLYRAASALLEVYQWMPPKMAAKIWSKK